MSALARYLSHLGIYTAGYDKTPGPITRQLLNENISVTYKDDPKELPAAFRKYSKEQILAVYTPAIPADNNWFNFFKSNGYFLYKRAEVLGLITRRISATAVAGTHGKTSVSVMTACIMKQSHIPSEAFLGGISKNLNSNLMLSEKEAEIAVVEADEFDRSFLQLNPSAAVITSIDADHLDIYKNLEDLKKTFSRFTSRIDKNGFLLLKKSIELPQEYLPKKVYRYSLSEKADFYAKNISTAPTHSQFDLVDPEGVTGNIQLNIPGQINIENAVAASALALLHGVRRDDLRKALAEWRGTERRFDYVINTESFVLIDDYAHHPKELHAFISSVRQLYPEREITGVFQPHLYSRTRDFAHEFARELSFLDRVIMTEIYPAREKPIPGVNSQLILNKITNTEKIFCPKNELPQKLAELKSEVVLLMGAGDIALLRQPVAEILNKKLLS